MKRLSLSICIALICTLCRAQPEPPGPTPELRITTEVAAEAQPASATTTLPAGTRVMMQLASPLNTESAVEGSGVYLETSFPVIYGNRVAIPAGTSVQGVIAAEKRAGHFNRVAEFRMHFTTLAFANGYTAPISGTLQSLPGSSSVRLDKKERRIKRVDQGDKALIPIAGGAAVGALAGSVRRTGLGSWPGGAALGAALGTGAVLVTRGDPIHLAEGTKIEMVLVEPLNIPNQQITEALKMSLKPARTEVKSPDSASQPSAPKKESGKAAARTGILAREVFRGVLWRR
jgi:hypothetical protein